MQILNKIGAFLVVMLSMLTGAAHAAVPTGVEAVFTGLATDFGTVVGYGWVLFLVVIGGLALFGIVKKVFNKSK